MKVKKKYKYEIEDYQRVMFILRHECTLVRKAKSAIEIVMNKTGFSRDKVEEIMVEMYEGDN